METENEKVNIVPIGAIWAAIATGMYNRKLISGRI